MTRQPGKQTIATHTLLNISRSKGNQTMKFDQLIDRSLNNKKEIQPNLCNIFSILIFNEFYLFA